MRGEKKFFRYRNKTLTNRVYSGAYGNGTVIDINKQHKGRKKIIWVDGKRITVPDPIIVIQFDRFKDPINQFDSDVGFLCVT